MSSSLPKIRRRIRSIENTGKLTKAMELIAGSRSRKLERLVHFEEESTALLFHVLSLIRTRLYKEEENPFFDESNEGRKAVVVFGPSLGLSGGYLGKIEEQISSYDDSTYFYVNGSRLLPFYKEHSYSYEMISSLEGEELLLFAKKLCSLFEAKKFTSIELLYGKAMNSLFYEMIHVPLFPLKGEEDVSLSWSKNRPPLLDESPNSLFLSYLPLAISSAIHLGYTSSSYAENIARRMAMEEANNNVDELLKDLTIEYNKERQNSITQEITEVVAGSQEGGSL